MWLIMCKGFAHLFACEYDEALVEGRRIRSLVSKYVKRGLKVDEDPLKCMLVWSNDLIRAVKRELPNQGNS
jgi:uncharacterized NAD(P)/FAD-binding protein YdhS